MNTSSPTISWEMLKRKVLPTAKIRDIDRQAVEEFGMNSLVLMENAAGNCVSWIRQRYPNRPRSIILCGAGNNGGDGIAIARHLRSYGWSCECFVLGNIDKLSNDARANAQILLARPDSGLHLLDSTNYSDAFEPIATAELIIDALLGTGASGNPRHPMSAWIEAANNSPAGKVAIDVPTGINSENGEIGSSYFHTDATLTFVALKPAMANPHSAALFGEVEVLPIGIPEQLIKDLLK